ncbi:MAG: acyltransferase family protein [Anaerolineae bacterium]|nr:acyltransferase family protein [Anaerolineae bacterium]
MNERRYDIDWLRVIAMLATFVYHCTRFFDTEGWHLKNSEQSFLLEVAMDGLIWTWVMELFFLVSGAASWYALKSRPAGAYLWERVKRLLIPLYTVGLFILLPPQFYFELFTNEGYRGTFWETIPRYFSKFGPPRITSKPDTLFPMPFQGHLWFLQYLFLISLMTLPLLLYLKSGRGQRWITGLAGWCDRRGGIFLFVIPLALALIGLRELFGAQRSWADFLWYAIYFVIGYVIAADQRFTDAFKRHGWIGLALWIVGFWGVGGLLILVLNFDVSPGRGFSVVYVVSQIIWSVICWSAVVFMLGIGARYLNFNHKVLAYGNEAVLPFYLFHQTIILAVGFFVIPWNMGILPKFLIVAAISFPLILVLYELLVRRFNVVRFFFGMRPKKKPLAARPASPAGAAG